MDAFLKEARTLASISHPNIVKVRRFFRAGGTAYIVMDYVEGRAFSDVLAADFPSGGFPSSSPSSLLLSLLDGPAAVHRAGIIHRDFKPGNILIDANGNPILIDFGAARKFQRTRTSAMTVIMTPGYAPIEQYSEDDEQGPFTDVYSLGCVAYRAITGRAATEPYKRLRGDAFGSAVSVGAGRYPTPLLSAIDWAIQIHSTERPQSASELSALVRTGESDGTRVIDRPSPHGHIPTIGKARVERGDLDTPALRRRAVQIFAITGLVGAAIIALGSYRGIWFPPGNLDALEQARQDGAVNSEADRKTAEAAAKEVAEKKAAEAAAKQEADRKAAAIAARRDADKKAAAAAAKHTAERKATADAAAKLEVARKTKLDINREPPTAPPLPLQAPSVPAPVAPEMQPVSSVPVPATREPLPYVPQFYVGKAPDAYCGPWVPEERRGWHNSFQQQPPPSALLSPPPR